MQRVGHGDLVELQLMHTSFQYQQHNASRADDSDNESYTPRTPRRTPMACTFCRGTSRSLILHVWRAPRARLISRTNSTCASSFQVASSSAMGGRSARTAIVVVSPVRTCLCECCSSFRAAMTAARHMPHADRAVFGFDQLRAEVSSTLVWLGGIDVRRLNSDPPPKPNAALPPPAQSHLGYSFRLRGRALISRPPLLAPRSRFSATRDQPTTHLHLFSVAQPLTVLSVHLLFSALALSLTLTLTLPEHGLQPNPKPLAASSRAYPVAVVY